MKRIFIRQKIAEFENPRRVPIVKTEMTAFKKFAPYVKGLQHLSTRRVSESEYKNWSALADRALNGEPSKELRLRVSLNARRAFGTFFTGAALADLALKEVSARDIRHGVFMDPTCGVGDLLVAAARRLPNKGTLQGTLRSWGSRMLGMDLNVDFIGAAKARLVLLARQQFRCRSTPIPDARKLLPGLKRGNALTCTKRLPKANVILLNPPFSSIAAPRDCAWATGTVNAAAVFLDSTLKSVRRGTKVIAILPEVLRTGSRYECWRNKILQISQVKKIRCYGVFDSSADVDVFVAVFIRRKFPAQNQKKHRWQSARPRSSTIGHFFDVSVGPVVPFRHPHEGPWRSFLHPRNATAWRILKRINAKRQFKRPLLKPPFVVIRRTSRPGDNYRAIGSIVIGKRPLAVENHLIVCTPKLGGFSACRRLLRVLKSPSTTAFLNQRIRCRHLTVQAVKELPYRPGGRRTSAKS